MNDLNNPRGLKSVLGFEIYPHNRLWVLDQGKVNGQPAQKGSIKLYIFDLTTDEILVEYYFSEEEAPLDSSFLNDIVVDLVNHFAYITDSGLGSVPLHGGLLVYDLQNNRVRRVLNQVNSTQPDPNLWITINGDKVLQTGAMETGADGIALTQSCQTLYWCPLTGTSFYSIPTELLRNFSISDEDLEAQISQMDKGDASDGLACSNEGDKVLYMTSLQSNAIVRILVNQSTEIIAQDSVGMVWPDTLGFDHNGSLVYVTNRLYHFVQDQLDFNDFNFRIWKLFIGANSYMDPN